MGGCCVRGVLLFELLRKPLLLGSPFIPGLDGSFRGIRGGIWRDMAGYREIPGDTRRYTWI